MVYTSQFHFDKSFDYKKKTNNGIVLWQIGDLMCSPNFTVQEHKQWCYEITLAVSGKGVCFSEGRKDTLSQGDIQLCRLGEMHNIVSGTEEPLRFFYLGFSLEEDASPALCEAMAYLDSLDHAMTRDRYDLPSQFCAAFCELIRVDERPEVPLGHETILANLLENIILYTCRNFQEGEKKLYAPHPGQKGLVDALLYFVDTNIRTIGTLSYLGQEFGYSYAYLSRLFTKHLGVPLKEYVMNKKFTLAAELLTSRGYSVSQTAAELNFPSLHGFSRAFKKHFGLSPNAYAKAQANWSEKGNHCSAK